MRTYNLHFSTSLALISFIIGTLLFGCHFLDNYNDRLMIFGLFYLIFAIIINLIVFFYLIMQLVVDIENQEQNFIRILILLSNIPIALLYIHIIFN